MKVKVTEKGVLIPRKFLKGVKEVEVRRQNGLIVIVPVGGQDPIFDIGKNPVKLGLKDASVNHDKYIYGS
jgi:virulence-associated protein VagC